MATETPAAIGSKSAEPGVRVDTWGLRPPPGVATWWGARAIFEREYVEARKGNRRRPGHRAHWNVRVDLLWDRQGCYGDNQEVSGQERAVLTDWLDNRGLKMLRKKIQEEGLERDEDRLIYLEDTHKGQTFVMNANPRKSHGYPVELTQRPQHDHGQSTMLSSRPAPERMGRSDQPGLQIGEQSMGEGSSSRFDRSTRADSLRSRRHRLPARIEREWPWAMSEWL